MEDHKTKIVVLESGCPHYQAGDRIYFSGAFIEKEKSAELCAVALKRRLSVCICRPPGRKCKADASSVSRLRRKRRIPSDAPGLRSAVEK